MILVAINFFWVISLLPGKSVLSLVAGFITKAILRPSILMIMSNYLAIIVIYFMVR